MLLPRVWAPHMALRWRPHGWGWNPDRDGAWGTRGGPPGTLGGGRRRAAGGSVQGSRGARIPGCRSPEGRCRCPEASAPPPRPAVPFLDSRACGSGGFTAAWVTRSGALSRAPAPLHPGSGGTESRRRGLIQTLPKWSFMLPSSCLCGPDGPRSRGFCAKWVCPLARAVSCSLGAFPVHAAGAGGVASCSGFLRVSAGPQGPVQSGVSRALTE